MNTMIHVAPKAHADEVLHLSHLSEEQIDDQLIGDLDGIAAAHLADCAECSQRVAEAAEPMATFRDVTVAWSERRSATMPIPTAEPDALIWQRRAGLGMTACALVIGISLVSNGYKAEMLRASEQSAQTPERASTAATRTVSIPVAVNQRTGDQATQDVAAQYSGDNRMLKAIDSELDASVDTPAAMGLETVSDQPRSQSGQSSVQD
jgi:hypothetical protein